MGRLQQLRFFMENLVKIPFVRGDPSLIAFLSCQDDKDFEAAREQTSKLTVFTDQSEGTVAWREGLATSSPLNWDRLIYDFKNQLDVFERDAKTLSQGAEVSVVGCVEYPPSHPPPALCRTLCPYFGPCSSVL